jgi:hypothetical protein
MVDYSADGVRLVLDQEAPTGAALSLLPVDAPVTELRLLAEVRYCRAEPSGGFTLGCRFREPPPAWLFSLFRAADAPPEDVAPEPARDPGERTSDPFLEGSASERRRAIRRKGSPVAVLLSDPQGREPPRKGLVVDRSLGGLSVLVEAAVVEGTALTLLPAKGPDGSRAIEVEVKSS